MTEEKTLDINELRKELDGIDGRLAELTAKRLETAVKIGAYKRVKGLGITCPEREKEVLASVRAAAPEGLEDKVEAVYKSIIEASKAVQREGLNVYLIGMPDCGKTRLGKAIAKQLNMPLIDTDKYIMRRMGMSIDGIFASLGEEAFRSMETMLLKEIAKAGGSVAATGGGMPLFNGNDRLMRSSGITVFLDRRLERLYDQATRNRPLLAGDVNANIKRLYNERYLRYLAAADVALDPDEPGAAARTAECVRRLMEKR